MRGGKREGAGRKSKYGSPTIVIRVPINMVDNIRDYIDNGKTSYPLYACSVSAGFPSPADDYVENRLDLNDYLVSNTSATFFVRAAGDSMLGAGIHNGDLLIVDRSIEPVSGKIVIAALYGELTVKRFVKTPGQAYLMPENDLYEPIPIKDNADVHVWGVVTNVIHKV